MKKWRVGRRSWSILIRTGLSTMNENTRISLIEENIIQKLLKYITLSEFNINTTDEEGRSLMHLACQMGMEKLVKILLQNNAHINQKDCFGRTPIMLACYAGYKNIVDMLMKYHADINCHDVYGFGLLTLAIYGGYSTMECLFNKNLNPEPNSNYLGYMPLLAIVASIGNEELMNLIISYYPEQINVAIEKSGMTPLMLAICGGYITSAKQLISHGASCNMTSKASLSSICYALKLSFPLLELKIPELALENQANQLSLPPLPSHPLTPNLYLSPVKKVSSPKKFTYTIKKSMRAKRSRSLDNKKKLKISHRRNDDVSILMSIFEIAKLQQYWPIFKEQQISFRTFLTMDEEDLRCIGISKPAIRNKFLSIIEHYNHIFYL
ncbi:fibronectin type 3 and ankyrin repeat domains protein 1 isoform X2 [Halyomorpha halys]|uniref:fibronectin type 3 and ankyrin repeat domains protein 1 isoform X2 n=1 Tax=Halyomorpha halys TaxID=286706 RepID=UPI0006D4EF66|nr:fibronectin type 3 and ankyrin repeat domains protein 1 isoform X2 [Halyomorpha halys]